MKRVQVTWLYKGEVQIEIVETVSDDDPVYLLNNTPVGQTVEETFGTERVWFEDDDGIFGLSPADIISIEDVAE